MTSRKCILIDEVLSSLLDYITESLKRKLLHHKISPIYKHQKLSIVQTTENLIDFSILQKLAAAENIEEYINCMMYVPLQFHTLFNLVGSVSTMDDHQLQKKILVGNCLLDNLWQKLNTGSWKNVPIHLRLCFSWTCIALVYYSLHKMLRTFSRAEMCDLTVEVVQAIVDIIQLCDRGLIMGYNLSMNPLHRIAQDLHFLINTSEENIENIDLGTNILETNVPIIVEPVDVCEKPSLDYFLLNFCNFKKPVVLKHIVDQWKAILKWKDFKYFKEIAGFRIVPIEIGTKYTDESWSQSLISMQQFINEYVMKPCNTLGYLAQHELFSQIPSLMDDILVPEYCLSGTNHPRLNIWLGPKGTISPLHHDPDHNILVQVIGRKYIRIYEEDQTKYLYPYEDTLLNNTSQIDIEEKNALMKWPLFSKARYKELILNPGEAVYIPPLCWHYVRSLSPSCSVSFWWEM